MPRYVAIATIRDGWAPAYQPGDPVPETNVQRHGYLEARLVKEIPDDVEQTGAPRPEAVGAEASATRTDADDEKTAGQPAKKGR